eukprot:gene7415-8674_t
MEVRHDFYFFTLVQKYKRLDIQFDTESLSLIGQYYARDHRVLPKYILDLELPEIIQYLLSQQQTNKSAFFLRKVCEQDKNAIVFLPQLIIYNELKETQSSREILDQIFSWLRERPLRTQERVLSRVAANYLVLNRHDLATATFCFYVQQMRLTPTTWLLSQFEGHYERRLQSDNNQINKEYASYWKRFRHIFGQQVPEERNNPILQERYIVEVNAQSLRRHPDSFDYHPIASINALVTQIPTLTGIAPNTPIIHYISNLPLSKLLKSTLPYYVRVLAANPRNLMKKIEDHIEHTLDTIHDNEDCTFYYPSLVRIYPSFIIGLLKIKRTDLATRLLAECIIRRIPIHVGGIATAAINSPDPACIANTFAAADPDYLASNPEICAYVSAIQGDMERATSLYNTYQQGSAHQIELMVLTGAFIWADGIKKTWNPFSSHTLASLDKFLGQTTHSKLYVYDIAFSALASVGAIGKLPAELINFYREHLRGRGRPIPENLARLLIDNTESLADKIEAFRLYKPKRIDSNLYQLIKDHLKTNSDDRALATLLEATKKYTIADNRQLSENNIVYINKLITTRQATRGGDVIDDHDPDDYMKEL